MTYGFKQDFMNPCKVGQSKILLFSACRTQVQNSLSEALYTPDCYSANDLCKT